VLDPLYYAVSAVMRLWHELFAALLGAESGVGWALAVAFLVLTLRALMIRPFLAQLRSARAARAIAPQLAELRRRHRDDPATLLAKTREVQSRHGVSTWRTFLPALVQAPVFLALLHVLHSFNRAGLSFAQNAAIANYAFGPDDVRSFLQARLFGAPLSSYLQMPQDLLDSFGAHVDRLDVALVVLPLLLLAAAATFLTTRASMRQQPPVDGVPPGVLRAVPWLFPLGLLVSGLLLPLPVAILVYWLTSNAWTLVQQRVAERYLDRSEPPPEKPAAAAPRPGAKPVRRKGAGEAS
jgi:YidC/Oxa1 family membrane protein insertase